MQPGVLLILKLRAKLVEALFRQDVERAKAAEPTGDEPEQNRQLTTDAFLPTSLGTILMDKSYDKPREDGILVRIWHPFFLEYCRPIPLGFGLLGLVFFVEFARSWTVGVYLPHPVIGAWVAWEAFSRAYKACCGIACSKSRSPPTACASSTRPTRDSSPGLRCTSSTWTAIKRASSTKAARSCLSVTGRAFVGWWMP